EAEPAPPAGVELDQHQRGAIPLQRAVRLRLVGGDGVRRDAQALDRDRVAHDCLRQSRAGNDPRALRASPTPLARSARSLTSPVLVRAFGEQRAERLLDDAALARIALEPRLGERRRLLEGAVR